MEQGKPSILDLPKVTSLIDPKTRLPIKRISLAQIEERKKKGLCYNCVEKWAPGHKCENAVFLLDYIEVIHKANSGVQITELDDANGVLVMFCIIRRMLKSLFILRVVLILLVL